MKQAPTFNWSWLHPRFWLTWFGLGLFALLAFLPWQWRRAIGNKLGLWLYRYNHKRHHIVSTNIALCFPELTSCEQKSLARSHLQEYCCAMLDYSVLFFRSRSFLHKRTVLKTSDSFQQAVLEKKNIILFLGHSVWLEFAPLAVGKHYRSYGSYKPFKNPIINWLIAHSRLKDVAFVISRDEGMLRLARSLNSEQMMIFLPDQDHGEQHSVYATFMGKNKATLNTPPRLAKLGKAQCFPMLAFFNERTGHYEVEIGEKLENYPSKDSIQDANTLNTSLEHLIRKHPKQYMWTLKLFKTQPEQQDMYR